MLKCRTQNADCRPYNETDEFLFNIGLFNKGVLDPHGPIKSSQYIAYISTTHGMDYSFLLLSF